MAGRKVGRESLKYEKAVTAASESGLGLGALTIAPKTTANFSFVAYAFHKGYRYVALEGSSRSGKTYAALQWCVYACLSPKTFVKTYVNGKLTEFDGENLKIRCLRYDAVNARDSIWSDLNRIMASSKIENGVAGFAKNETKMTWTFPNGSQIICGGANDSGKLHGLEQDICYFNEVMMIPKSALDQLEYRTRIGFIFDWNPSLNEHWVFRNGFDKTSVYGPDERLAGQPKCLYAHSTYKDNLENLTESQVAGIEQYEPTPGNIARGTADAYMWSVYGLGKRGFIEGRVVPPEKVEIIPEYVDAVTGAVDDGFPSEKQWEMHGYGLDWGFAADPTALVECAIWNKKLYVRELIYEKNLIVSPDPTLPHARSVIGLLRELKIRPTDTIVADSARPDLNSALRNAGFQVADAYKPGGSIENGVNLMNQRRWAVCERSKNIQFELENWTWAKDRYGNTLRKPIDKHNHCLVGGTKVRTRRGDVKIKDVVAGDEVLTRRGYRKVLRSWKSGENREVYKVTVSNGNRIVGTGNHGVLTPRGFVPIEELRIGDKVLCIRRKSKPMAKCGTAIRSHKDEKTENTFAEGVFSYTTTCGSSIMGLARRAATSITGTVTAATMRLKTLWSSLRQSTRKSTASNGQMSDCDKRKSLWTGFAGKHQNGTEAPKGLSGTKSTQNDSALRREPMLRGRAKYAGKSLRPGRRVKNSVRTGASQPIADRKDLMTLLNFANGVEDPLKATNIRKSDFVVGTVQEKELLPRKAKEVFDLTVEDTPEFFANGVLVHNCMDATRYFLSTFVSSGNILLNSGRYEQGGNVINGVEYADVVWVW